MTTIPTSPGAGPDFAKAIKDAGLAFIVSLLIFGPLIGLKTEQNMSNVLVVQSQFGLMAIFVGIITVGRFLMSAFIQPYFAGRVKPAKPVMTPEMIVAAAERSRRVSRRALIFLFVYPILMVVLFGFQGSIKWVDNFGVQILIYVMLGWGLNIVIGLAGLLDLGYVAFYAVGAYSYALLAINYDLSFWVLLPIAGVLAAMWGVILGFPVLRLRGDYLAIVTLAFGEIIRLVLINWKDFSGGAAGITSIPKVTLFGIPFDTSPTGFSKIAEGITESVSLWFYEILYGLTGTSYVLADLQKMVADTVSVPMSSSYYKIFLYYLILCLALLTAFVTLRLRRLPIGRAWEALREDEVACRSLGINTTNTKLSAFATGAMFAGFAGSFFAARQGFVSPESFVFMESAVIVAIVVLGGMGSMIGVALAAVAMIGGTELLRELDFLKLVFGNDFNPDQFRMLIFGLAMVVVMVWKPRGFVSARQPTAFLFERKAVSGDHVREGHG
jgi:branched-chain amino acid transport system permease protein